MGCPICLDAFSDVASLRPVTIKCGHLFHQSCLSQWLKSQSTSSRQQCPSCKADVRIQDVVALFPSDVGDLERWGNEVRERAQEGLIVVRRYEQERRRRERERIVRGKKRLIEDEDEEGEQGASKSTSPLSNSKGKVQVDDAKEEEAWLDILLEFERALQAYVIAASHGRRIVTARIGARSLFKIVKEFGDEEDGEEREKISALKLAIESLHDAQARMTSSDQKLHRLLETYESLESDLKKERDEIERLRQSVEEENQKLQRGLEKLGTKEKEVAREKLRQVKARGLMEREACKAKLEAEQAMDKAKEVMAAANKCRLEVTHTIAVREAEMKAEVEVAVRAKEEAIGRQHEAEKERDLACRKSNALADQMRILKGQVELGRKSKARERERRLEVEMKLKTMQREREEERREWKARLGRMEEEGRYRRDVQMGGSTATPSRSRPGIESMGVAGMASSKKRSRSVLEDRTNVSTIDSRTSPSAAKVSNNGLASNAAHSISFTSSSPPLPHFGRHPPSKRVLGSDLDQTQSQSQTQSQTQDESYPYETTMVQDESMSHPGDLTREMMGSEERMSKGMRMRMENAAFVARGGKSSREELDREMDDEEFPMPGMARIRNAVTMGRGLTSVGTGTERNGEVGRGAAGVGVGVSETENKARLLGAGAQRDNVRSRLTSTLAATAKLTTSSYNNHNHNHNHKDKVTSESARGLASFGVPVPVPVPVTGASASRCNSTASRSDKSKEREREREREKDKDSVERRMLDSAKRLVMGPKRRVRA